MTEGPSTSIPISPTLTLTPNAISSPTRYPAVFDEKACDEGLFVHLSFDEALENTTAQYENYSVEYPRFTSYSLGRDRLAAYFYFNGKLIHYIKIIGKESPALLDVSNPFTIETWIKPNISHKEWQTIISNYEWSIGDNRSFQIVIDTGGYVHVMVSRDGSDKEEISLKSSQPLIDRAWSHIAVSYTGTNMLLWINGNKDGELLVDAIHPATYPLTIGSNNQGTGQAFTGLIDSVRIYKKVKTAFCWEKKYHAPAELVVNRAEETLKDYYLVMIPESSDITVHCWGTFDLYLFDFVKRQEKLLKNIGAHCEASSIDLRAYSTKPTVYLLPDQRLVVYEIVQKATQTNNEIITYGSYDFVSKSEKMITQEEFSTYQQAVSKKTIPSDRAMGMLPLEWQSKLIKDSIQVSPDGARIAYMYWYNEDERFLRIFDIEKKTPLEINITNLTKPQMYYFYSESIQWLDSAHLYFKPSYLYDLEQNIFIENMPGKNINEKWVGIVKK